MPDTFIVCYSQLWVGFFEALSGYISTSLAAVQNREPVEPQRIA